MVEYSEEVKKLAETLKNSGLAASMTDALERAQSMIGVNEAMNEKKEGDKAEEPVVQETDAAQTTLSGEEKGVSESAETEQEMKKEEVFTDEAKNGQSNQEETNSSQSQQKKIDLSEIFNVNK